MKRCRSLLIKEMDNQFKQLKEMLKLRSQVEDPKTNKSQRPYFKRKLADLEKSSWYSFVHNSVSNSKPKYNLMDLRIICFIRSWQEMHEAKVHSNVRALTRGAVGSSAETVVEHLLSIFKKQNKENLDWNRLLLKLQFQALGPLKHEENALKEKLMVRMKNTSAIRATVKDKTRRKKRSPHIKKSIVVDRLCSLRQRYRGFC